jgi:hypothetical protein
MKRIMKITVVVILCIGLITILPSSKKMTKPDVTTTAVSEITQTSAMSGGNVTDNGGVEVTARGVCWGTTQNPTINSGKTSDSTDNGVFSSEITGLSVDVKYYVRTYATNKKGTSYGNELSFTTTGRSIGDSYQGGIIGYILQSGDPGYNAYMHHGLIVAPSDQSTGIKWYNGSYIVLGATETALGTGNDNTKTIVASQGAGNYAAKLCYDLVLGGYSDWYLPSNDELGKLYASRVIIGDFADTYYWSSSKTYSNNVYWRFFGDNLHIVPLNIKRELFHVRAVRFF